MAGFKLDLDYIDVATRLTEFFAKYPEGSMQQQSIDFRDFAGKSWVVYTAAAYRTPDDTRPGIGTAWEPVPGTTNFTRDSEMQNAETAAWGRAIVAVGAANTKKGIASAEEVRNRQNPAPAPKPEVETDPDWLAAANDRLDGAINQLDLTKASEFIALGVADGKCGAYDRKALGEKWKTKHTELGGPA